MCKVQSILNKNLQINLLFLHVQCQEQQIPHDEGDFLKFMLADN